MTKIKEKINDNLKYLNEEQLQDVANYTSFLKIKAKMLQSKTNITFDYSNDDILLVEEGMEEYNNSLNEEDEL